MSMTTQQIYDKVINHLRYGQVSPLYVCPKDDGSCAFCAKGCLTNSSTFQEYYKDGGDSLQRAEKFIGREFTADEVIMMNKLENSACDWDLDFTRTYTGEQPSNEPLPSSPLVHTSEAKFLRNLSEEDRYHAIATQHGLTYTPRIEDSITINDEVLFETYTLEEVQS